MDRYELTQVLSIIDAYYNEADRGEMSTLRSGNFSNLAEVVGELEPWEYTMVRQQAEELLLTGSESDVRAVLNRCLPVLAQDISNCSTWLKSFVGHLPYWDVEVYVPTKTVEDFFKGPVAAMTNELPESREEVQDFVAGKFDRFFNRLEGMSAENLQKLIEDLGAIPVNEELTPFSNRTNWYFVGIRDRQAWIQKLISEIKNWMDLNMIKESA